MRTIAPFGSALLALSFMTAPSAAAATGPTPLADGALGGVAIMRNVASRNDGLRSFESSIAMDISERSFPFVRFRLNGTTYFQAPDRYAVVFEHLPGFMKGLPHAYASMLNVGAWPAQFVITCAGKRRAADRDQIALDLTPRKHSTNLEHARAYVDAADWTVDEVDWSFDKMEFDIVQQFQMAGPFRVLAGNRANIRVPHAHAVATTTFANYRTNVAIDQNIFGQS
jgi:hypothetical protein